MKVVRLNPCTIRKGPSPIGFAVHILISFICAVVTVSLMLLTPTYYKLHPLLFEDIFFLTLVSYIMLSIVSLTLPMHIRKMATGYTLSVRQARYLVYQSFGMKISLLISKTNYSVSKNLVTLEDESNKVLIYFKDDDEIEPLEEFLYEVFNL